MGMKRVAGIARYIDKKERVIIWCSGTNGWGDCRDNLRFRRISIGDGMKVSLADYEEAVAVIQAMRSILDNIRAEYKRIDIAGISKGGAVAAIVSILLKKEGLNVRFEGFAPKRFGNRAAMKFLDNRVTSFITACPFDMVPFLPFWWARVRNISWSRIRKTPWRAHMDSTKEAAKWRHVSSR